MLLVIAMSVGYGLVYVVTPLPLEWQIATSFDRLFTQLWPALVWSAFQLSGSRELSRPTAPAAILNPQEALPRC
jgi:hypothetical protein